jgi:GNAT superfamily N-acetyltransferase
VVDSLATWRVRVADPASAPDLADLVALREEWRGPGDATFSARFGAWWRAHDESHDAVIGELDGTSVAMAWLAVVDRVPSPDVFVRRSAYVQSVFVSEQWRDRGLGARLMAELLDLARARGLDYVAVHPSARAFSFYRRLGFDETTRVLELDWRDGAPGAQR